MCFSAGGALSLTVKAPVKIPADPSPETARPIMRAIELGETAETIEPISNIPSAERNIHLMLNSAYSLPYINWKQQEVRRYDDPYQPTSGRELKSAVILGMAVPRMVRS